MLPDQHWKAVVEAILARPKALGIRPITFREPSVHPGRDPGVRIEGAKLLATLPRDSHTHALLVLDYDGCGDARPPAMLEADLQAALRPVWGDQGLALVVEPEIEAWLIGGYTHLRAVAGLNQAADPRAWWHQQGIWARGAAKPQRPKEALDSWLTAHRSHATSSVWRALASRASLDPARCRHESFKKLIDHLRRWFPPTT